VSKISKTLERVLSQHLEMTVSRYSADVKWDKKTGKGTSIWQYQVCFSNGFQRKYYQGRARSFLKALRYAVAQFDSGAIGVVDCEDDYRQALERAKFRRPNEAQVGD